MSNQKSNPNDRLIKYLTDYLSGTDTENDELEVRFGTKTSITQIQFDAVISKLKSLGFEADMMQGKYHLNIQPEFTDPKTGRTKISNIRTEVNGLSEIQKYCKKNTFDLESPGASISFNQKTRKMVNDEVLDPIDYDNFGFRVNYKKEIHLRSHTGIIKSMLETWTKEKKIFRLIKRFTFKHDNYPLKVDCSIVRSSTKRGRRLIPEYRIESSNVFSNNETYEIEIELLKHGFPLAFGGTRLEALEFQNVLSILKRIIKYVLSGLQNSNFPISSQEQSSVMDNYLNMIHQGKRDAKKYPWYSSRNFVGFSSVSLELSNIAAINEESDVPNIRKPYTVTEKADGIRKLLYINKNGKVYFIDVNMNVQFTGIIAENRDYHESLIDGEHVLHDKFGKFINYYMAFDAYYVGREDIRSLALADTIDEKKNTKTRLAVLHDIVKESRFQPLLGSKLPLTVEEKTFYVRGDIFKNCNEILSKVDDDLFIYETDGLIFTPSDKGVGSNTVGEKLPPTKITWNLSFKWKPPEFNTIDFLVTTKKTESGEDFIGNIFEDGVNSYQSTQLTQYKTLILRVGFSERMHGYLNPCEDIIQGNIPSKYEKDDRDKYKPVPFYPTDPTPNYPAYLCNIILEESDGINHMLIEDRKESFEDGMIVEFKYDQEKEKGYQWIPIRVRKKKTAEYRAGKSNFGNAYHVALSVWRSIHNPVTEDMVRTGKNIPSELAEEDIYYNRKSDSTITRALRDFHNLFVKRILIMSTANRGDILIDQSVGKGGDFPKWIAAKLSFVFGIDYSRDNIENRINGACARFLNYRKKWKIMPMALFVSGNSGLNIRSGEAIFTDKGKEITKAIFGEGAKDEKQLGPGVYKQFGVGRDGFHIVSNQFSIHYFFENKTILNAFLRNVSECCKVGGYFIGTSYDGTKVFRALENKEPGEGIRIMVGERKMWEITKQYDSETFDNDESCLGYQINVYQESINKVFPEYLVNYEYLIILLEQYGFALLTASECKELGLPSSMGSFSILFSEMQHQIKSRMLRKADIGDALNMTSDEKKVSFLNKYFVFKKIRDVNAEEVEKIQLNLNTEQMAEVSATNVKLEEVVKDINISKPRVKKLGKLKLNQTMTETISKPKLKIKLGKFGLKKDDK